MKHVNKKVKLDLRIYLQQVVKLNSRGSTSLLSRDFDITRME